MSAEENSYRQIKNTIDKWKTGRKTTKSLLHFFNLVNFRLQNCRD